MSLEMVVTLLRLVHKQMEDLWIERQALGRLLYQSGLSQDQLDEICSKAKDDPAFRAQAQKQFAQMRESLDAAAKDALLEALEEQPPPSGEPS
jgi:outer membrane murein-binding lipoprotein Lpp